VQDMDAEGLHASPLIIRLIIQTIRLDLWIDDPSNLSRADPSLTIAQLITRSWARVKAV
jgi:hypothetical protein